MKLTHKIILILLLFVFLPFVLVTYLNYTYAKETIKSEVLESLSSYAERKLYRIEKEIFHVEEVILLTVKDKHFIKMSEQCFEVLDKLEEKELFNLFRYESELHDFHDLFLISIEGDIKYTLKKEDDFHTNLIDGKYSQSELGKAFREVKASEKLIFSNFRYYEPSQKPAAFIIAPIFKEDILIGYFAVQINGEKLYEMIQQNYGLGGSGESLLATKIGNKALFVTPLRYKKDAAFNYYIEIGSQNGIPIQKAVQGESGTGYYVDYSGHEILAVYGYIDKLNMGLVVKVDTKEAYIGIVELKKYFLLLNATIFILLFFLMQILFKIIKNLEQKREQYEYAIAGSQDGLWDWNLVKDEIYFSPRWKEMLGYSDDELENNFETWQSRVHPDDLQHAIAERTAAQLRANIVYESIYRMKHKDGSWVWILNRGQTLFENERSARMIGFHTDITKQKEQEFKIQELSTLLSNTLNSFENLVFVKDSEFRYIECNIAFEKFVGISRDKLLGKSDYDLFSKEIADFFRTKDEEMLASGVPKNNYEWVTYPDGEKVYLLTSKSPLHDVTGNILGLVGNSINVTREKDLELELKMKDEVMIAQSRHAAMGEMISMIAHQWRQPISVIAMDANNILADIELEMLNEEDLKEASKDIVNQTKELSKTINDFREFFKPNKNTEKILLKEILNDALSVIGKSLENNNIELVIDLDKSIEIKTFSRELMQVLINIIKNAKEVLIEKEIQNSKIHIKTSHINDEIVININDNAGGINKDILDKIFDPYFTTKGEKNGTGLGLYMSKTIIDKHLKGSITAFNKDGGACFEIRLPVNLDTIRGGMMNYD